MFQTKGYFFFKYYFKHKPKKEIDMKNFPFLILNFLLLCKMAEKQSEAFHTFLWHHFFQIIKIIFKILKCVLLSDFQRMYFYFNSTAKF